MQKITINCELLDDYLEDRHASFYSSIASSADSEFKPKVILGYNRSTKSIIVRYFRNAKHIGYSETKNSILLLYLKTSGILIGEIISLKGANIKVSCILPEDKGIEQVKLDSRKLYSSIEDNEEISLYGDYSEYYKKYQLINFTSYLHSLNNVERFVYKIDNKDLGTYTIYQYGDYQVKVYLSFDGQNFWIQDIENKFKFIIDVEDFCEEWTQLYEYILLSSIIHNRPLWEVRINCTISEIRDEPERESIDYKLKIEQDKYVNPDIDLDNYKELDKLSFDGHKDVTFLLVGFQYRNNPLFFDKIEIGDTFVLAKEPTNPVDKNAIAAYKNGLLRAYVQKDDAVKIKDLINVPRECTVVQINERSVKVLLPKFNQFEIEEYYNTK